MIYEFLYKDKPLNISIPIISFLVFVIFLGFFVYFYHEAHPQKQEPSSSATYRYDPELRKHVTVSTTTTECSPEPPSINIKAGIAISFLLSILLGITTLMTSAISFYDYTTAPSKNTKTTDIYRISKERNYLTFTLKKPYNHLYKTKTMEITYENPNEYVIIANHQTYKISKEVVKE